MVVNSGERRIELQPGEMAQLPGGQLRYEYMTSWMGYKVFYDPNVTLAIFYISDWSDRIAVSFFGKRLIKN